MKLHFYNIFVTTVDHNKLVVVGFLKLEALLMAAAWNTRQLTRTKINCKVEVKIYYKVSSIKIVCVCK